MNRSLFLHVVERLEGLVGRLPATIQRPILSELTPLKELFLKQRPPRFVFAGSWNTPLPKLMTAMFPEFLPSDLSSGLHRRDEWREYSHPSRGTISILDARSATSWDSIRHQLTAAPADIICFVEDEDRKKIRKEPLENLLRLMAENRGAGGEAGIVGLVYEADSPTGADASQKNQDLTTRGARLHTMLETRVKDGSHVLRTVAICQSGLQSEPPDALVSAIVKQLPNEARIEAARVFRHSPTQNEIAQLLVKSTSAICTAIGAQPIPLADLPILTTLQLVMVSGIMYVSGRERSLRAATEFVAALGANVGAGMLLREGARAILKLVPGWGNVVCGMVAGAGTYAIGRAAIAYFLEGLSLNEARRAYLTSRRSANSQRPALTEVEENSSETTSPKRGKRLRLRD